MKQAVADHTKDVLNALKARGVNVEWVQVGNETTDGMLWNDEDGDAALKVTGRASRTWQTLPLISMSVMMPSRRFILEAKVIVHLDKGKNLSQITWMFDGLKQNGAKWDVIGMSLYPDWITDQTWEQVSEDCLSNIKTLSGKYNCDVIISEIGMGGI